MGTGKGVWKVSLNVSEKPEETGNPGRATLFLLH